MNDEEFKCAVGAVKARLESYEEEKEQFLLKAGNATARADECRFFLELLGVEEE